MIHRWDSGSCSAVSDGVPVAHFFDVSGGGFSVPMPQSLSRILVHVVFSTKDRRPYLRNKVLSEELHRYLGGIARRQDCPPVVGGGVEDHIHLLCTLSRTRDVATLVKELKRGSSAWLKSQSGPLEDFAWQGGYGAFSVGSEQAEIVRRYIVGQEEHHHRDSFQDEFRRLLERHGVAFDERHVWD